MLQNSKYFVLVMCFICSFFIMLTDAYAKVKGDPELLWLSPLGDEDIEETPYNMCRIIKSIKPGVGQTSTTTKNLYDIFSNYISNLYAQSIKISAYIAEEEEDEEDDSLSADISNEIAIIEEGIIQSTADIARRINIINSFEAGIAMLDALEELDNMAPGIYSEFLALDNGNYDYVSDCEYLNKAGGK